MPAKLEALKHPTAAYVAPFAAFVALMALERAIGLPAGLFYTIRFIVVLGVLLAVSRPVISLRVSAPLGSAAVGVVVFLVWIAPDVVFGPGYRQHWVFENFVNGMAATSAPESLRSNLAFLAMRAVGCALLVPVLEELFWRGWLMRWLVAHDFLKVPIGAYVPFSFWTVAVLFGSEHGPYWEVGLLAGIIYNWWCVRTKSLADCIAAHSVTNGLLSIYVLYTGAWQYWL